MDLHKCPNGDVRCRVGEGPARTSQRFNLISAVLAFVLWGGWAFHVNRGAVTGSLGAEPWVSGLIQGSGSFLITLLMVRAIAWLYARMSHLPFGLVLPAVIVVLVTGSCLAAAHVLAGTAHIVATIAPALGVAFVFNVYTAMKLQRMEPGSLETMNREINHHE
jgi:hypothetical protein